MRYNDLREVAPAKNIQNMISAIALSLISSGREQVRTQSLSSEIEKRTGIQVPYGVLMDILNSLPYVTDANSETVTLQNSSEDSSEEDVEEPDTMLDMADAAEENGGELPPDYESKQPQ